MQQIKLFFFVLSIIYTLRFIVELGIRLFQDNPDPISIKKLAKKSFPYEIKKLGSMIFIRNFKENLSFIRISSETLFLIHLFIFFTKLFFISYCCSTFLCFVRFSRFSVSCLIISLPFSISIRVIRF